MPVRSVRIRQATRGGPIDKLKAVVEDLEAQVKEVKATVKSSHMIHDDGTYSNSRSTVSRDLHGQLTKNMILKFGAGPHVWSAVVHKITDRGVYCRPDLHIEPDLSRCTFYSWEELNRDVVGAG